MRTIDVSVVLDADLGAVRERLTPRSIIEYQGTYGIEAFEETDDGWLVTAVAENRDLTLELLVRERPDGYVYEQIGDGPFEELTTTVTIRAVELPLSEEGTEFDVETDSDEVVRVRFESEYTFGGLLAPILNWRAADARQKELQRALLTLAEDLDAGGDSDRET